MKKMHNSFVTVILLASTIVAAASTISCSASAGQSWIIDSQQAWKAAAETNNLKIKDGLATPTGKEATYRSPIQKFEKKRSARSIVFEQSADWQNWKPIAGVGPSNLRDAPVFLALGPHNYWMFGRYGKLKGAKNFKPEAVKLDGFDVELQTTPDPHQFNAPGGLKKNMGGYHAWQSRDMVNWVHHGNVTEGFSRWVTTAEYVDGKFYIYYDYPNDQDPHLYIDKDLTDGMPGKNMGMAFRDPSHGSDCGVIRDLKGRFHIIYEDWSPINARRHAWDSPLAGHAVGDNGINNFKILDPAVDERTEPTGKVATYRHPHWKQHPDWDTNIGKYNVHEPEQNAFGDWAAIGIGGRYYLFGDFHPAKGHMGAGWFTSESLYKPFTRCGKIGRGHPDPDIGFAEGKFYLITQMKNDFVSPGPWVEKVEARVGVDTDNDGKIDTWTDWTEVKETYDYIEGFAKQIKKTPAAIDLSDLVAGCAYQFEFKTTQTTDNGVLPVMDKVTLEFEN